jgi:hypothetical protein
MKTPPKNYSDLEQFAFECGRNISLMANILSSALEDLENSGVKFSEKTLKAVNAHSDYIEHLVNR